MNKEGFKRKLTAVLSADVAGFSWLMCRDEGTTVMTLCAYREAMTDLIERHRGRVVDSPGDNLLAEFASVVDAVEAAVAVQKDLGSRNSGFPLDQRMQFRIGINLGDVIEQDGRLYGTGVNMAARLEAMADPGGICISRAALDHVQDMLPLGYQYLGKYTVKNICREVEAFRVLMEPKPGGEGRILNQRRPATKRKALLAVMMVLLITAAATFFLLSWLGPSSVLGMLPGSKNSVVSSDKPSIAVLPFDNLSGDPGQEYLSDGLSEDLITALSAIPRLLVIARNSTFTYKGKPIKVQKVGRELGVQYVVEGSIQTEGDRVRITAQLIDAASGNHLWAERYERELKDIFSLQDEITLKIVKSLQIEIGGGQQSWTTKKAPKSLDAYLKILKGRAYSMRTNMEDNGKARQLFEEAVVLDPEYPGGYISLARAHLRDVWLGWSPHPMESIAKAVELVDKALALDPSDASIHSLLSQIHFKPDPFVEGTQ